MKINKIITLANKKVRLQFLAMERSLRATGCKLPIWVIPYDDNLFELPKGSKWWVVPEIIKWLGKEKAHPTMRKYQCLTESNYQFVDSDIIFLRNPEKVLKPLSGFISSCLHWCGALHTTTPKSLNHFKSKTTTWQKDIFNTGQFACDRSLFSIKELKETVMKRDFIETCIRLPWHEQPGINLLVFQKNINITNLTLLPYNMESTWAGDYPNEYKKYWKDSNRKPYLIHWAGGKTLMNMPKPIDELFYKYLTPQEKGEWDIQVKQWRKQYEKDRKSFRTLARRLKHAYQIFMKQ